MDVVFYSEFNTHRLHPMYIFENALEAPGDSNHPDYTSTSITDCMDAPKSLADKVLKLARLLPDLLADLPASRLDEELEVRQLLQKCTHEARLIQDLGDSVLETFEPLEEF